MCVSTCTMMRMRIVGSSKESVRLPHPHQGGGRGHLDSTVFFFSSLLELVWRRVSFKGCVCCLQERHFILAILSNFLKALYSWVRGTGPGGCLNKQALSAAPRTHTGLHEVPELGQLSSRVES